MVISNYQFSLAKFTGEIQTHWAIEDQQYWHKDIIFRGDHPLFRGVINQQSIEGEIISKNQPTILSTELAGLEYLEFTISLRLIWNATALTGSEDNLSILQI